MAARIAVAARQPQRAALVGAKRFIVVVVVVSRCKLAQLLALNDASSAPPTATTSPVAGDDELDTTDMAFARQLVADEGGSVDDDSADVRAVLRHLTTTGTCGRSVVERCGRLTSARSGRAAANDAVARTSADADSLFVLPLCRLGGGATQRRAPGLLHRVAAAKARTRMGAVNLGVVFGFAAFVLVVVGVADCSRRPVLLPPPPGAERVCGTASAPRFDRWRHVAAIASDQARVASHLAQANVRVVVSSALRRRTDHRRGRRLWRVSSSWRRNLRVA